ERWTLNDCMGKTFQHWDSRDSIFTQRYDEVHRPIEMLVREQGGTERVYERIVYGEGAADDRTRNLRGKPIAHSDTTGQVAFDRYDFKGNLLASARQMLKDYTLEVDWSAVAELEDELFEIASQYDALNRPIEVVQPRNSGVIYPQYNEANLLESVRARLNK